MILNFLTNYVPCVNEASASRWRKLILSTVLLMTVLAINGCGGLGKPDAKCVGSWISSTSKSVETLTQAVDTLTLKADGTYERTMGLRPVSERTESGKWGVKNGQLNLQQDKLGAEIETYSYRLNDKGDQLQLTKEGFGGGVPIAYRKAY